MNRRENTREHSPLWIATFAAFIARGWGSRDAMIATDRALEMIRNADAAGDTREHSPLWIATFAAFIARGGGTRDALVATDRALKLVRSADAAGDRSTATAVRRERVTPGYYGALTVGEYYGTLTAGCEPPFVTDAPDGIAPDEQGHEVPA